MDKLDFFKSLEFSEYESKTISSLIRLKNASAKEINHDSGVPQNKLYNILKIFEKKGILAILPDKKYQLINLKTFINNKIEQKENKLIEIKKSAVNIEKIKYNEEFFLSLIKGQKAIMNKLAEKNPDVKKEILGVQRNWKYWGEGIRVMKDSIKRGVDVRMIGVINEETEKRALEWKKIGCKIKKYNEKFGNLPLRFTIFDNKEARITIGKPEIKDSKDYITIWTSSKPLINILRKQFMEMWKESEKF